ncbi:MAG: hypothetical protein IPM42_06710 [Saprospiraceae bacterium]|nr:hypothetical protein [Saprospiraceae bacterium]
MSKYFTYILFLVIISGFFHSCKKGPLVIEKLNLFTETDSIHNNKSRIYIVENFCNCTIDVLKFDSIVCNNIQGDSYNYTISFFAKSKITNNENLQKFPKDLGRHSLQNDILVQYRRLNHFPYFTRYDYYIDKVNMLEIESKLVCKDGKAIEYTEENN